MLHRRRRAALVAAISVVAVATLGTTAGAGAAVPAKQRPKTVSFTETITGAQVSQNGSTSVSVWTDKNSVDGDGAGVVTITINGNEATGSGTQYWANGAAKFTETFTLGTASADGTIPYTGSGKCAGGTGVHKNEKCDFTFDGSVNPTTTVFNSNVTGTLTR
jgi:hypothetical protein